ncbi:MAG: zinc ribbon domain-containing protein [Prevotella sp.]|nr:zinc ribbon domain-containing protein [Prevotella sp.]
MKCPECNTEVEDKLKHCPECGAPITRTSDKRDTEDDEPKLGRGMMAFIVIGLLALIAFGTMYYANHYNDPDYFRTIIDPDSNLADKDLIVFDTTSIDTAEAAKAEKEEKKEAEKIYNSIRRKPQVEESVPAEATEQGEAPASSEPATPSAPTVEAAPTPKIEAIETE